MKLVVLMIFPLSLTSYVSPTKTIISNESNEQQVAPWGIWGVMDPCPPGTFAQGFRLKVEPWRWTFDDTALNAIRLYCGPKQSEELSVTSIVGPFGYWTSKFHRADAVLVGFQLLVEKDEPYVIDQTQANNIRFWYNDTAFDSEQYVEGGGLFWGSWGLMHRCNANQAICGIQTLVEPDLGVLEDDTGLNNVRFQCCDLK